MTKFLELEVEGDWVGKNLVDPEARFLYRGTGGRFLLVSLSPFEAESEAERRRPTRLTGRPSPRSSESTAAVAVVSPPLLSLSLVFRQNGPGTPVGGAGNFLKKKKKTFCSFLK